jgi:hypothetical protein
MSEFLSRAVDATFRRRCAPQASVMMCVAHAGHAAAKFPCKAQRPSQVAPASAICTERRHPRRLCPSRGATNRSMLSVGRANGLDRYFVAAVADGPTGVFTTVMYGQPVSSLDPELAWCGRPWASTSSWRSPTNLEVASIRSPAPIANNPLSVRIRFDSVQGKDVCLVAVAPSAKPVFAKPAKGTGSEVSEFWVRIGNATKQLHGDDMVTYQAEHWG